MSDGNEKDLEDLQEFVKSDPAQAELARPSPARIARDRPEDPYMETNSDQYDQSGGPKGTLVQYGEHGQGFLPTTRTVSKLRPGVYTISITPHGGIFVPHHVTTDNLLRLSDSRSDEVISEIESFWVLKERFKELGFTHKRGILLWGPPGSGKTSTVAFIMKQLVANGGIVLLGQTSPAVLSEMLSKFRQVEPTRQALVILEDLDAIIDSYGESETLSILDGENSVDNVVFIATTNYPEKLDGRVKNRPSRFDRVVKIGLPSAEARRQYLESRKVLTKEIIDEIVDRTDGFSIAHLKEVVVSTYCYGSTLESVLKRLSDMAKNIKSDDTGNKMGFGD